MHLLSLPLNHQMNEIAVISYMRANCSVLTAYREGEGSSGVVLYDE
jgi:hypothetical protein